MDGFGGWLAAAAAADWEMRRYSRWGCVNLTNAARLIGSPDTILERIELYKSIGIEMLHLGLGDEKFKERVFPKLRAL